MLLVIDVGNTNTVLGVFARVRKPASGDDDNYRLRATSVCVANWRVATRTTQHG